MPSWYMSQSGDRSLSLATRSFSVAKRVRSETGIGQMAVSVSYAAVELARKIFGSLSNKTVMIAGARTTLDSIAVSTSR